MGEKTIRQQLKEFRPGAWIKVYWPDPSADPVEDGSSKDLVEGTPRPRIRDSRTLSRRSNNQGCRPSSWQMMSELTIKKRDLEEY